MRLRLLLLLALTSALCGQAQSWETVKNSRDYIYGEGWGATVAEADKQALNDLISKISVQVVGSTSHDERETADNNGVSTQSVFRSAVHTYSQATLNNTEKIILENEPDAHVGRWIRRSEVNRIFESRKSKISDYVESALKAEGQGKIDVALKDFYWAYSLLRSLQNPEEMKQTLADGRQKLLTTWIPEKMDEIFSGLRADVVSRRGDDVELRIYYRNLPVNSVDYTFWDGRDWSNIYSAKDGVGVLELAPGHEPTEYRLKFEYEFASEARIDPEVDNVLQVLKAVPMKRAYLTVKATPVEAAAAPQASRPEVSTSPATASGATTQLPSMPAIGASEPLRGASTTGSTKLKIKPLNLHKGRSNPLQVSPTSEPEAMSALNEHGTATFSKVPGHIFSKPEPFTGYGRKKTIIEQIIQSIQNKTYKGVEDYFTPYGLDIYQRLIKYGKARIVGNPDIIFYNSRGNVTARGVRMSFSFPGGLRKSFVEDIVFTFNDEGKIDNISFGLGDTAEDDILGKGVWSEEARFAIINFLENYQTAYALKRLDYIESIFDDDAVIITGSVVHKPGRRGGVENQTYYFNHDIIRYNRHTKDSYLRHLKRSFASKDFINIRFADNDIRKLGKGGEMYAIQISQEYYSSNYGDKGYLFLMVDINDPKNPVIKVRTWQPEKDPEFGLYGPEHFK